MEGERSSKPATGLPDPLPNRTAISLSPWQGGATERRLVLFSEFGVGDTSFVSLFDALRLPGSSEFLDRAGDEINLVFGLQ
jgi:hypothetical protein